MRPSLLIVGAAPESLGAAVAETAGDPEWGFGKVVTAGINCEDHKMDATNHTQVHEVLYAVRPDIVVCTVGINQPAALGDQHFQIHMFDSYRVNVLGPLGVLQEFLRSPVWPGREGFTKKFVAVSSNSARIPRRGSLPYCASKAALSMALRVVAREQASGHWDQAVQIWGYEPGLLAGTPMTKATEAAFDVGDSYDGGGYPMPVLHRMKGVESQGIPVQDLAYRIVSDVAGFSVANNGLLFPFDADEQ